MGVIRGRGQREVLAPKVNLAVDEPRMTPPDPPPPLPFEIDPAGQVGQMLWPEGVDSITRQGVTIVGNGSIGDPYRARTPGEIPYIGPCQYCRTRLVLDSRSRCRECGAPERLAAKMGPLFVPPVALESDPALLSYIIPAGRTEKLTR